MDMTLDEVIAFKRSKTRRGRGRGRGRGAGRGGGAGAGGAPGGPQRRTWRSRGKATPRVSNVRTRAQQRLQQARQKARSDIVDARRRLSGGGAVATSTPITTPTSQRGSARRRGRGTQGGVSREGSRLKIVRMRGRGGKLSSKIKLIRTLKKDQTTPTVRGRGSGRGRSRGRGIGTRQGRNTMGQTPVTTPRQDPSVSSPLFTARFGGPVGTRGGRGGRGRGRGRGMRRPVTSRTHPDSDENGSGDPSIKISVPQEFEVEPRGVDLPLDFAASHHTGCSLHSRFSAVRSPQRLVLPNGRAVTYHT